MIEPKGDVTKLSKWAQRYIESLTRKITDLEKSLDAASSDHPNSNVVLRGRTHRDPDIGLRPDSTVFFYAGDSREPLTNMIEVRHDHANPNRLHIASYGSRGLRIITSSGNAFLLEMEER